MKSWISHVIDTLSDHVLQILIAAAFVSLIVGEIEDPTQGWLEGAAILLAVSIVVLVASSNEYSKAQQFKLLNAQAQERDVTVIRSGSEEKVSVFKLVVGDVLLVEHGDIVPIDGILFRCHNITTDESSITGESENIHKSLFSPSSPSSNPYLFSGSQVLEGSGAVVVCAVGLNSFQGRAQVLMEETEEVKTPLQDKLDVIADDIGKIGVTAGVLTFLALILDVVISVLFSGFSGGDISEILDAFIIMVTIIVVAVPEGLPLAVTLSLAYSVGKMKEENNFVRHLQACETMGGADNICSDKTGTMTESSLNVVQLYLNNQSILPTDYFPNSFRSLLSQIISHNSTAILPHSEGVKPSGNVSEIALLSLLLSWNIDYRHIRDPDKVLVQYPFSSTTKRMMTTVKGSDGKGMVCVTGAPENVIELCGFIAREDGDVEMSGEEKGKLQGVVKEYTGSGLRCLALAYKEVEGENALNEEDLERSLRFVAVVGMQDKVRDGVPEAVIAAQRAGVVVRMVTGDNLDTAIHVAKHCNLLPPSFTYPSSGFYVMDGQSFRQYTGKSPDLKRRRRQSHSLCAELASV